MGLEMFQAAPTSGVTTNYNALANSWMKESQFPRQVARIGLAGGAAAGDIQFKLFFGDRLVAELIPTTVGAAFPTDDDMMALSGGEVCPAGVEMRLIPSGNADTNVVYGVIETKELISLGRLRRR